MADDVLRESAAKIKTLKEENQRVNLDNDRLTLQLERVSTDLALIEEQKADMELKLKQEIKYILTQYVEIKKKLDTFNLMQAQEMPHRVQYPTTMQSQMHYGDNFNTGNSLYNLRDTTSNGEEEMMMYEEPD